MRTICRKAKGEAMPDRCDGVTSTAITQDMEIRKAEHKVDVAKPEDDRE